MTTSPRLDLSALDPPTIIQGLDYESVLAALVADMQTALADVLPDWDGTSESDPILILLQQFAYRIVVLTAAFDDAARGALLAHATGSDLDHLAALLGTARREIAEADDSTAPPTPAVMEPDDELRARAQLAMEALSTAGPAGAYLYHALAADGRVRDAHIDSPTPGTVVVTLLSREGDGTAPPDLVGAVQAYLSADERRPLTDTVEVQSATIVPWRLEAMLHCYPGPATAPVLDAARKAAEAEAARLHALGHDVTRSALYAALHQPGVQRVELTSPAADIAVAPTEAPHCAAIVITEGGRDV